MDNEGNLTKFFRWLLQGHTGDVWIRSRDCPPTSTTIVMPHAQVVKDLFGLEEIPLADGGKLTIPVTKSINFVIEPAETPSGFSGEFIKPSVKKKRKR